MYEISLPLKVKRHDITCEFYYYVASSKID